MPILVPGWWRSYLAGPCAPRGLEATIRALDPLVFSSLWAALVAPLLMLAATASVGLEPSGWAVTAGFTGTLVIYGVDRLRDLGRDRSSKPARSAYITEHRAALSGLYMVAAALGAFAMLQLPAGAWLPVGAAGALGLFHRRLKGIPSLERAYVTFAWVAVCAGLPVAAAGSPLTAAGPPATVFTLAIAGNLIASQAGETLSGGNRPPPGGAQAVSVGCCLAGLLAAWALPGTHALWPIPALEALAVLGFAAQPRDLERYALVVVDGALAVGAALAWLTS